MHTGFSDLTFRTLLEPRFLGPTLEEWVSDSSPPSPQLCFLLSHSLPYELLTSRGEEATERKRQYRSVCGLIRGSPGDVRSEICVDMTPGA